LIEILNRQINGSDRLIGQTDVDFIGLTSYKYSLFVIYVDVNVILYSYPFHA